MGRQADSYCERGRQLLEEGKYLLALEYYQAANELEPERVDALFGQICSFKALGRLGNAEEMQRRLDAVIQKNPSQGSSDMTTQGQWSKAKRRYAQLLQTLALVEKDKFDLKHACYPPEADRELSACEGVIESLEHQLKIKVTDFKRERKAALASQSSSARKIKRVLNRKLSKYRRKAYNKLRKTGRNKDGVKTFGYSAESLALLDRLENEIRTIDSYLPSTCLEHDTFRVIRNKQLDLRTKYAKRWTCWKLKRKYAWFVFWHLVRKKNQRSDFELSPSAYERDREMRNRIATLDEGNGKLWCQLKTNRMVDARKALPRILLFLGISAAFLLFIIIFWRILLIIAGVLLLFMILGGD